MVALCGHPLQALDSARRENNEHVDRLAELLSIFEKEHETGQLKFCTMTEVEKELRAPSETERAVHGCSVMNSGRFGLRPALEVARA